ncbi:hypothetical protein [Streptomyces sp. NBC_00847]|uniref:hypothetical protein n=1 Tax=Streptomyces sp. NBC_00847 TaxID=2975850 RepID=UPI00225E24B6|nr:hypothetical protein [Streptomyces sp. NBC_00847]MCX4885923.1 hypothetical protein [Streptomyces sp. NBC_00847]
MSETTELDKTRRYLRPVKATCISDDPDGVHLAVYSWLPMFDAWATGPGICGESMSQGPLPEGAAVTCASCLAYQPKYERYLAPGYQPGDDDPEVLRGRLDVLRKQAETSMALLGEFVTLAGVAHKYGSMGGHDVLGENLSCAGCELARRVREHLEEHR